MVVSWGTGLPEELLLLVRENREDWTLHGLSLSSSSCQPTTSFLFSLSLCTSPIIPLLLLCPAQPAFSLLLFSAPSPTSPISFHTFISLSVSLSKDSVNQTESQSRDPAGGWTGFGPCSGDGLGGWESLRLLEHTRTHTQYTRRDPPSPSAYPCFFIYLSFQFTGWLDFITSTIIWPLTIFDRERQRRPERGSGYIIFLNTVHIVKLCHHLTR